MADCYALINSSLNIEWTEEEKLAQVFIQEANKFFHSVDGKVYAIPSLRSGRDMDLVVWMHFDNFFTEVRTGYINKPDSNEEKEYRLAKKRKVWLNSALLVIELKKHNNGDYIRINNGKLFVRYHDNWHNASDQNFEQVFALRTFLQERLSIQQEQIPKIQNLIWLYQCPNIFKGDDELGNVIFGELNFPFLLQKLFELNKPVSFDDGANIQYSASKPQIISTIDAFLNQLKKEKANGLGHVTRNKLNLITQHDLDVTKQNYFEEIGKKLTIIKGNPGTGKTIHLAHLAFHLRRLNDFNPIILTYNRALVQDIQRMMIYSGLQEAIQVSTIHSFFINILSQVGIIKGDTNKQEIFKCYEAYLMELKEFGTPSEISDLVQTSYDVALIDEAQDCLDIEKELIFILFGPSKTVVSYGNKQVVREKELNWSTGIPQKQKNTKFLEVSHRNKQSLVSYFNTFSREFNNSLSWNLKENRQLFGGKLKLYVGSGAYDRLSHNQSVTELIDDGYSMYDMMFLVPSREGSQDHAKNLDELLTSWGHQGFNATTSENKKKFFPINEHRILNYKSCRGLEAWYLVCWKLDLTIAEIIRDYKHDNKSYLSHEEGLKLHLDNWLFMIFTRAIDTLFITLDNDQTTESKIIIELAESSSFSHMTEIFHQM